MKIFDGIPKNELNQVYQNLQVNIQKYHKNSFIYHSGDVVKELGIVMSGRIGIIQRDAWGKENIFNYLTKGEMFAESYACMQNTPLLVDVIAVEDSTIMFIDVSYLWRHKECPYQDLMIQNLLHILVQKNLHLSRKIVHITPRMIKDRLLSYLHDECIRQHTNIVFIPYNRQQLADYLCVDRSALSNEISKLSKIGVLKVKGNYFILHS